MDTSSSRGSQPLCTWQPDMIPQDKRFHRVCFAGSTSFWEKRNYPGSTLKTYMANMSSAVSPSRKWMGPGRAVPGWVVLRLAAASSLVIASRLSGKNCCRLGRLAGILWCWCVAGRLRPCAARGAGKRGWDPTIVEPGCVPSSCGGFRSLSWGFTLKPRLHACLRSPSRHSGGSMFIVLVSGKLKLGAFGKKKKKQKVCEVCREAASLSEEASSFSVPTNGREALGANTDCLRASQSFSRDRPE